MTTENNAAQPGLTDDEILHRWDIYVSDPCAAYPLTDADKIDFARAIESALLSKLRAEGVQASFLLEEALGYIRSFSIPGKTAEDMTAIAQAGIRRFTAALASAPVADERAVTSPTAQAFAQLAKQYPVRPTDEAQHSDDAAVDRFATAMKSKLAKKRAEGRGGWEDKEQCGASFLSELLHEHVEKGDPLDVGNLAMMLHQRGERIAALESAPVADTATIIREVCETGPADDGPDTIRITVQDLTRIIEGHCAPVDGEADQEDMERRGWVNIGYKHDLEKARRAISFCDIPGFDGMSLDNAIYWLRNQVDNAAPQAGEAVRNERLERANKLPEVECPRCELKVISSCGSKGCPTNDGYADLCQTQADKDGGICATCRGTGEVANLPSWPSLQVCGNGPVWKKCPDCGDCAKGAGDDAGITASGDERAALEMLIREAQAVVDDYHRPRYTRLDEALQSARAALSPTPAVVKQSLTATQTGEKGEKDAG